MARQIQADQALEHDAPPREGRRKKYQQASGSAPVRHHVQHSTELCGLLEFARCETI